MNKLDTLCYVRNGVIRVEPEYIKFFKNKTALLLIEDWATVDNMMNLCEWLKFFIDNWLDFIIYMNIKNIMSYLWNLSWFSKEEANIADSKDVLAISEAISRQFKRVWIDVKSILAGDDFDVEWIDDDLDNNKLPIIYHEESAEWLLLKDVPHLISQYVAIDKLLISSIAQRDKSLGNYSMLSIDEARQKIADEEFPENVKKYISILIEYVLRNPNCYRWHLIALPNDTAREVWTKTWIWLMVAHKSSDRISIEKEMYSVDAVEVCNDNATWV